MIVVIGASGGLGRALAEHALAQGKQVLAISRGSKPSDFDGDWFQVESYQPAHLTEAISYLKNLTTKQGQPLPEKGAAPLKTGGAAPSEKSLVLEGVISAIGVLHTKNYMPEKRLEDVNLEQLVDQFVINGGLPLLLLQQLKPLLPRKTPCYFVQLSAKVGSITDNHLGGWYSYRASKAALNMLLKTASIEFKRTHKQLTIAAIHPGTTDTELSKPFQERLPADKLFTPELSAQRIWQVVENLKPEQSGDLLFWDGERLPY